MKRYTLKLLTIILAAFSLSVIAQEKQIKADRYKTAKFDAAIFPAEYFVMLSGKRFTPSKAEIDRAEKALGTKLEALNVNKEHQSSSPVIHKTLNVTGDNISGLLIIKVTGICTSICSGLNQKRV